MNLSMVKYREHLKIVFSSKITIATIFIINTNVSSFYTFTLHVEQIKRIEKYPLRKGNFQVFVASSNTQNSHF